MSTTSYKDTLNLPHTSFPMKASLVTREKEKVQFWQEHQIYKKMLRKAEGKPRYILHDGPPYANGHLHVGHALNKILKDVIVKYHAKRGFQSLYTPGWDCHGLPIEIQVQKKLSAPYSKNDLRKACRVHAENFLHIQKEEFLRLLVFGDFENRYSTMDFPYEAKILETLEDVYKKGLLYRENRPVSWCIHCATALADAEIEYTSSESPSLYVSYPVKGHQDLSFLVWTTTPWTLPASVGLSIGRKIVYGIFTDGFSRYILAKERHQMVTQETGKTLQFLEDLSIETLLSWKAQHPFLSREIAVIQGDHVTLDSGTGVVHTAPAHGVEDFQVGYLQNHLSVLLFVDNQGRFSTDLPELDFLVGETVWKANPKILEKLRELGQLFHVSTMEHSYPHCWRCKNPLIVRSTFQWFIRASSLISDMKKEIEKVRFIPSTRKERMLRVVENRPDWCISRQRVWGVPIPSLRCSCEYEFFYEPFLPIVREKVQKEGADFWFDPHVHPIDLAPFLIEVSCPQCGQKGDFQKGEDILDVWFDSGVSWKNLLENHYHLPMETMIDLYLEGNDQFRAWYQVSLITALVEKSAAPYGSILTHGMVLDENGRAMSKSLGNVLSPEQIINQYGADILRLWVVSQNYTEDTRIGETILNQISDMYRKLRNTFRFLMSNLYDFSLKDKEEFHLSGLYEIDRWVLVKLDRLQEKCWEYYDKGQFDEVTRRIFTFMNEDLSSFYLDVLKDTLYTLKPSDPQRRSAQYAMLIILQTLMDLLSPILSFTMEEVYSYIQGVFLPHGESIFLTSSIRLDYQEFQKDYENLEKVFELRHQVLKELENLRQKKEIGSNLEAKVIIHTKDMGILNMKGLDYYFIVSECELRLSEKEELQIEVQKGTLEKCPRCYRYVSSSTEELCPRCQGVMK